MLSVGPWEEPTNTNMSIDSVEKYNELKFQGQQISSHVNHLKIF
jgi:hypothetical protein